jgi:very-short-patch-repair endonuclease
MKQLKLVWRPIPSKHEKKFLWFWQGVNGPKLEAEYPFMRDFGRKFRLDFAHVKAKVGFEIHGGTWVQGRHNTGSGFEMDCIKRNYLAALGWTVFELTPKLIRVPALEVMRDFILRRL